jgi:hypothetical protein
MADCDLRALAAWTDGCGGWCCRGNGRARTRWRRGDRRQGVPGPRRGGVWPPTDRLNSALVAGARGAGSTGAGAQDAAPFTDCVSLVPSSRVM